MSSATKGMFAVLCVAVVALAGVVVWQQVQISQLAESHESLSSRAQTNAETIATKVGVPGPSGPPGPAGPAGPAGELEVEQEKVLDSIIQACRPLTGFLPIEKDHYDPSNSVYVTFDEFDYLTC